VVAVSAGASASAANTKSKPAFPRFYPPTPPCVPRLGRKCPQ
jgi:hypothetical protein